MSREGGIRDSGSRGRRAPRALRAQHERRCRDHDDAHDRLVELRGVHGERSRVGRAHHPARELVIEGVAAGRVDHGPRRARHGAEIAPFEEASGAPDQDEEPHRRSETVQRSERREAAAPGGEAGRRGEPEERADRHAIARREGREAARRERRRRAEEHREERGARRGAREARDEEPRLPRPHAADPGEEEERVESGEGAHRHRELPRVRLVRGRDRQELIEGGSVHRSRDCKGRTRRGAPASAPSFVRARSRRALPRREPYPPGR